MPQAEIDALFKQATGIDIARRDVSGKTGVPESSVPAQAKPSPPIAAPTLPAEAPPARRPVVSPRPRQAAPIQPVSPALSDNVLTDTQATLSDLSRRVGKVETSLNRLNHKVIDDNGISSQIEDLSQRLSALTRDLQKLNTRISEVTKIKNSVQDSGIRDDFTCASCGSHGMVAMLVKCSKCGEEGWWGWWPKDK